MKYGTGSRNWLFLFHLLGGIPQLNTRKEKKNWKGNETVDYNIFYTIHYRKPAISPSVYWNSWLSAVDSVENMIIYSFTKRMDCDSEDELRYSSVCLEEKLWAEHSTSFSRMYEKNFFIFRLQSLTFFIENSDYTVLDSPDLPMCHYSPHVTRKNKKKESEQFMF